MYEKAAFLARTGIRKIRSGACGFSSIKMHYSVSRLNEVYVFNEKKPNFTYSILWNVVTVCFASVELVIVFGMISVTLSSRYQSRPLMYIRGLIPRDWSRQFQLDLKVLRITFL